MSINSTFETTDCLVDVSDDADLSQAVDLGGRKLVAIVTPATLTGANITLKAATGPNGTYNDVIDDTGTLYTIPMTTDDYIVVDPAKTIGIRYLKLAMADGNEGADRTFTLVSELL